MRIEQLARKVQQEFEELYPREPEYIVGKIEDISGIPIFENSKSSLV